MDTNDSRARYEPGFAPWRVNATDYDFLMGLIENEEETETDARLRENYQNHLQAIREGRLRID
ncbi:hypothetical protein BH11ARM2_BH11ARM2_05010 [soil metagenome]